VPLLLRRTLLPLTPTRSADLEGEGSVPELLVDGSVNKKIEFGTYFVKVVITCLPLLPDEDL
jgi:hypothetical protein